MTSRMHDLYKKRLASRKKRQKIKTLTVSSNATVSPNRECHKVVPELSPINIKSKQYELSPINIKSKTTLWMAQAEPPPLTPNTSPSISLTDSSLSGMCQVCVTKDSPMSGTCQVHTLKDSFQSGTCQVHTTTTTNSKDIIISNEKCSVSSEPKIIVPRYKTRSRTVKARQMARNKLESKSATPPPKRKTKRRKKILKPSYCPKKIRVGPSTISGAGNGLFMMEDVKSGEWIARYSGDPLTCAENDERGHSHYRLQVHKNLFLDAANPKHFEGRFINDSRKTKYKVNARFAADYRTNTCSKTGHIWVKIFATKKIKAGEEVFLSYGANFWRDWKNASTTTTPDPILKNINNTDSMPAPPLDDSKENAADSSNTLWAPPAVIPPSLLLSPQPPSTSTSTQHEIRPKLILGHSKHTSTPTHTHTYPLHPSHPLHIIKTPQ